MTELKRPRPLQPGEPLDQAVYCANCKHLEQEVVGSTMGMCFEHEVTDSTAPMVCDYFNNDIKILSVLIFLESGISVYHKAIVPDISTQMDPQMVSSFLEALNMFGKELTEEQISLIQFQKKNILICRGKYAYGALLVKGEIDDFAKEMFSHFLMQIESSFSDYFKGEFTGVCLPETEVEKIGFSSMKKYLAKKLYNISPEVIEDSCNLRCAG